MNQQNIQQLQLAIQALQQTWQTLQEPQAETDPILLCKADQYLQEAKKSIQEVQNRFVIEAQAPGREKQQLQQVLQQLDQAGQTIEQHEQTQIQLHSLQ